MVLIGAAILPHGSMILDPTVEDLPAGAEELHTAAKYVGDYVRDHEPDIIVMATPHGINLSDTIGIYSNRVATGTAEWNRNWSDFKVSANIHDDFAQDLYHHLQVKAVTFTKHFCLSILFHRKNALTLRSSLLLAIGLHPSGGARSCHCIFSLNNEAQQVHGGGSAPMISWLSPPPCTRRSTGMATSPTSPASASRSATRCSSSSSGRTTGSSSWPRPTSAPVTRPWRRTRSTCRSLGRWSCRRREKP